MQVPVPAVELLHERRLFVLHQAVDNLLPLLPLLPRHNRLAARDEGTARLKIRNPEPLMLHADSAVHDVPCVVLKATINMLT